ncbi:unnamed protein product [Rotaria socialis]|uniref:Uncharacterized protein n=2 Tax=Rotaria socialis TaxID=392032 RepID=A0A817U0Y0_9BILA|nr:unnamed protein product [Rotaria socialis]
MDDQEEKKLYNCLNVIIKYVDDVLRQLNTKCKIDSKTTTDTSSTSTATTTCDDPLFDNSVQNNNVNSFSVDIEEGELLDKLTNDIQTTLKNGLPTLSTLCSGYIEQFLHEYHFDKDQRVFTEALTTNILYSFQQNLKALLMAAKAYPAAYRNVKETVKKFLRQHPDYKDKSGFWGTTLLYSAARVGFIDLVTYLIETVAATALHAACFGNHIQIVKYLIDKGANYFLRNQLGETPIDNGKDWEPIRKFFEDYLIPNYLNRFNPSIPRELILGCHDRQPNNCIWEYKLVKGFEWEEFTMAEHSTLSISLMPKKCDQSFNSTIHLSSGQSTYTINLLTFYHGSKNQEPQPAAKDSAAWIRCRGLIIANFDIHCIWQLMFVKCETSNPSTTTKTLPPPPSSSLDAVTISSVYDSKFQIKLNSWYTCDSELNALLDQSMNNRRRYVDINHIYIGQIRCNLFLFTFANDAKTILGFVRWIPKFIVNTPHNQSFIKELYNFQAGNQSNPIPLTKKRLEQSIRPKPISDDKESDIDYGDNDETESVVETEADDTDDSTQLIDSVPNVGNWCLADIENNNFQQNNTDLITTESSLMPNLPENADNYINEHSHQSNSEVEQVIINSIPNIVNKDELENMAVKVRSALENKNEQLKTKLFAIERQLSEQYKTLNETSTKNEVILNNMISN